MNCIKCVKWAALTLLAGFILMATWVLYDAQNAKITIIEPAEYTQEEHYIINLFEPISRELTALNIAHRVVVITQKEPSSPVSMSYDGSCILLINNRVPANYRTLVEHAQMVGGNSAGALIQSVLAHEVAHCIQFNQRQKLTQPAESVLDETLADVFALHWSLKHTPQHMHKVLEFWKNIRMPSKSGDVHYTWPVVGSINPMDINTEAPDLVLLYDQATWLFNHQWRL